MLDCIEGWCKEMWDGVEDVDGGILIMCRDDAVVFKPLSRRWCEFY